MSLHILNKGNYRIDLILRMAKAMSNGDQLLLIEDGTHWLIKKSLLELMSNIPAEVSIFALEADVCSRGLNTGNCEVPLIGYGEFVRLTENNNSIISWY